jgi:hypothetical protein
MLILIEGCDGTGKTTLANHLVTHLGGPEKAEIIHRGVPTSHLLDEYELPLFDYVPFESKSIICDRWHIGADVYGPLKRHDGGIDPVIYWHMDSYFKAKGALLVYTEMPLVEPAARVVDRGDDYIDPLEIPAIITKYREAITRTTLPVFGSTTGFHDAAPIALLGSSSEISAEQTGWFKSYVGPRRPTKLYIGASETAIAFMPYEGTKEYGIIKEFGLDNTVAAGFIDCREDLPRAWDALYNPFVVSLDEEADLACHTANIPFITSKDEDPWKT